MNAKQRKKIKSIDRKDYWILLHRQYDTRTVAQCVTDCIDIAIGCGLDQMKGTIY